MGSQGSERGNTMARKKYAGYVVLTCKYYQEGSKWVATCDELGTSTFGRSLPDAKRKLAEAVELHINTLEDVGETNRFFEEHNIPLHEGKPTDVNICVNSLIPDVFFSPCIQRVRELATA
jgi:predicted RNase H-like HicB family nuclease